MGRGLLLSVLLLALSCGVPSNEQTHAARSLDDIALALSQLKDEAILRKYPRTTKSVPLSTRSELSLTMRTMVIGPTDGDMAGLHELVGGEVESMDLLDFDQPAALTSKTSATSAVQADLRSFATPVKDQGQRPTCTAFSAVGALEFEVLRRTGLEFDLSEEQYWHRYGQGRWDAGLAFAAKDFLVPEAQWPYGKVFNTSQEATRIARITGAKALAAYMDTRAAIAERSHPVILITEENETWGWNFQRETRGLIGYQNQSKEGGHALLAVGIVESPVAPGGGFFILKNSWGAAWGDGGFAYLPFEYCRRMGCSGFEVTDVELHPQARGLR